MILKLMYISYFPDRSITPITGSHFMVVPSSSKGHSVNFVFTNLPSDNDQFGNKYIKASLPRFNLAESVLVKVFFLKYATNHPAGLHPEWPNWYYYWRQTSSYVLALQDYGDNKCTDTTAGYYWPWPPDGPESRFHICPAAAESSSSDCDNTTWFGIDLFAATEKHENQHLIDWWTFWPAPNGYVQSLDLDPPTPADSSWGDGVPDSLEGLGHLFPGLSPSQKDPDNDNHTDFDDFGYDAECGWVKGSADSTDWSNHGHQY
jgi:hypothetical protein